MEEKEISPLSFLDFLIEGLDKNIPEKEVTFSGMDCHGRYEAQALVNQEDYDPNVFETRRYFYENGRIRRIAKTFNEREIKIEEWSEDGITQRITCYDDEGGLIWEKNIDHRTRHERIRINRESYFFSIFDEECLQAFENGRFHSTIPFEIMDDSYKEEILEILGTEKAATQLPVEIIDCFGPNRLLKSLVASEWCFLELHCSSTGKTSYLRVPPRSSDVIYAIAWTFRMDRKDYVLSKET